MAKKIEINKDIREYKEKFLGPLSLRETVCLVLGVLTAYFVKTTFFSDVELASDVSGFIGMVCMIPFFIIGWAKPYGMYLEEFIRCAMGSLLSPVKRRYDNGLKLPRKVKKTKSSKLHKRMK